MKFVNIKLLGNVFIASTLLGVIGCTGADHSHEGEEVIKEPVAMTDSAVLNTVAPFLVNAEGEAVDLDKVAEAPILLFYYSAHWCPPCRLFTPKLVEFYKANGGGEKFEIIFVSSDRSKKAMFGYMEEEGMPWPVIAYDSIKATGIKEYGGPYIPSLVMFDNKGKLILATDYDNEVEPTAVLDKLSESI